MSFNNCTFGGRNLSIRNCDINTLCVVRCKELSIRIENDREDEYKSEIINDFPHKIGVIRIDGCDAVYTIYVGGKSIGELAFINFQAKETHIKVKLDGFKLRYQGSDRYHIDDFLATVDELDKGFISTLDNIRIDTFELTGILKDSTIGLSNTEVKKFRIKHFISEGKLRFNNLNLSKNGEGEVISSQMGKTEFNYVDLSKAEQFKIYLSNITELITTNTDFPNNIIGKDEVDFKGKREIYRQLKNAASKQADKVKRTFTFAVHKSVSEQIQPDLNTLKFCGDVGLIGLRSKIRRWDAQC